MIFKSLFTGLDDNGRIHLLSNDTDSDKTIFFLHGNSLCSSAYLPLLSELSKRSYSVYAQDIRGHGRSSSKNSLPLYDWTPFVLDSLKAVRKLDKKPLTAIGHSMGGFFLYRLAADFPDLFSKIILLDPIIFPERLLFLFKIIRALNLKESFALARQTRIKRQYFPDRISAREHYHGKGMFKNWEDQSLEGFIKDGLKDSFQGGLELSCKPELEARFYESVPFNTWSYAKKIRCPVYIIRGERSDLFLKDAALKLKRTLLSAKLHTIKDRGHFFPLEISEKCAELISKYIEED